MRTCTIDFGGLAENRQIIEMEKTRTVTKGRIVLVDVKTFIFSLAGAGTTGEFVLA